MIKPNFTEASKALEDAIRMLTDAGEQRVLNQGPPLASQYAFPSRAARRSLRTSKTALQLSRQIKHPHLLVVDGSRMIPFLERAKSKGGSRAWVNC